MRNLIVILMGGLSGERKISFLTGKACSNALKKKGINHRKLKHAVVPLKILKIIKLGNLLKILVVRE